MKVMFCTKCTVFKTVVFIKVVLKPGTVALLSSVDELKLSFNVGFSLFTVITLHDLKMQMDLNMKST